MYSDVVNIINSVNAKPIFSVKHHYTYPYSRKTHRCFAKIKSPKRRITKKINTVVKPNECVFYNENDESFTSGVFYDMYHNFRLMNYDSDQFKAIPVQIIKSIFKSLYDIGFYFTDEMSFMEYITDEGYRESIIEALDDEEKKEKCQEEIINNHLNTKTYQKLKESIQTYIPFHLFNLQRYAKKLDKKTFILLQSIQECFKQLCEYNYSLITFSISDNENFEFGETNIINIFPYQHFEFMWENYVQTRECDTIPPLYSINNPKEKEFLDLMFKTIYKIYDL